MELVCSDMWKTYLNEVSKRAGKVLYALNRFHVAGKLGGMIDRVRATEARALKIQS